MYTPVKIRRKLTGNIQPNDWLKYPDIGFVRPNYSVAKVFIK